MHPSRLTVSSFILLKPLGICLRGCRKGATPNLWQWKLLLWPGWNLFCAWWFPSITQVRSHELPFDFIPTLNVKSWQCIQTKRSSLEFPARVTLGRPNAPLFPLLLVLAFVLFIKYYCISNQSKGFCLLKVHFWKVSAHQQKIKNQWVKFKKWPFFCVCFTSFSSLWDDVSSTLAHDPGYVERAVGLAGNGYGTEHRLRLQLQTDGTRHWGYHGADYPH